HYAEHEGKPFYPGLVEYMGSAPLVALIVEGQGAIAGFRTLAGATNPTEAAPGTIRGDLSREWDLPVIQNLVHGSDSEDSAAREIAIWFPNRPEPSTAAHPGREHPGPEPRMSRAAFRILRGRRCTLS